MYPAPNCFFDSQHRNIKVKCGHRIHKSCLHSSLNNNNIMCPLCKKSIIDTTAMNYKIDYEISQNPMPEEYKKYALFIVMIVMKILLLNFILLVINVHIVMDIIQL